MNFDYWTLKHLQQTIAMSAAAVPRANCTHYVQFKTDSIENIKQKSTSLSIREWDNEFRELDNEFEEFQVDWNN